MEILQFDAEADCVLLTAARVGDGFQMEIEVTELDDHRRRVFAECERLLEFVLDGVSASSLELTDQHPLLWQYQHDSASAFFSGVPTNTLAAIGAMVDAHWSAAKDWIRFTKYLNITTNLKDLLGSGTGLLARGPVPLLEIYKQALRDYGTEVQIIFPYPYGGRLGDPAMRTRLKTESKALLLGDSYVTGMGWGFSDTKPSSPVG